VYGQNKTGWVIFKPLSKRTLVFDVVADIKLFHSGECVSKFSALEAWRMKEDTVLRM